MTTTTAAAGSSSVVLGGILGAALDANLHGRLSHFITAPDSPAIVLFSPEYRARNTEGDWYGEHAGKWLSAAARAYVRSGDAALGENLRGVADYLLSVQEADGYLGTYAEERRFTHPQPPKPPSWDGAPALRTWDIWVHAYLILGLVETARALHDPRYTQAAERIADLCAQALASGIDITTLGNHHGMSATVLMDAALELHEETGEPRFLALARQVLEQANAHPALRLLPALEAGADASEIATGKAYQLLWNLVALVKLCRATGDAGLRDVLERIWQNIREHHLTLGGGPWGGVAHRSREVFNARGSFSPNAYVETCSLLSWIQFNRELLQLTGEARFAEEIERTAYNDLLGAHAPNGEDWCYYSFPNGRRVHTTYWRCCKSSGAMALEELPSIAYTQAGNAVSLNLYGPGEASLVHPRAGALRLRQHTTYPFDGTVSLQVEPEHDASFEVRLRVPSWAQGATVSVNGEAVDADVVPGTFASVTRRWSAGDLLTIVFPLRPVLHHHALRNVQESRAPDGGEVRQQVLDLRYVGLTRGALVYATELIDGFKTEETIRLPDGPQDDWLQVLPVSDGEDGAGIAMQLGYRAPLLFWPYYRAGGREDGAWRLTWLALPPP
ncbi:MAG TPA: beta-L-arabinofuranosidase domain-containing protein [Pseudoxanthomonas sp.]|nr:beta-L-arabinofuranosidase domain-containing protein [Pseudoxanthomonas sp.]